MDRQTGELRLQALLDNGRLGIARSGALVALPPSLLRVRLMTSEIRRCSFLPEFYDADGYCVSG